VCQLCKKIGHTVQRCWKWFDRNYTGEERVANNAEGNEYNVDMAWYSDTGAMGHITSELEKLTTHVTSTPGRIKFKPRMVGVCRLLTLANLHFIHPLVL
jgi:hypothetical protein